MSASSRRRCCRPAGQVGDDAGRRRRVTAHDDAGRRPRQARESATVCDNVRPAGCHWWRFVNVDFPPRYTVQGIPHQQNSKLERDIHGYGDECHDLTVTMAMTRTASNRQSCGRDGGLQRHTTASSGRVFPQGIIMCVAYTSPSPQLANICPSSNSSI
jgi:hypothetical protein